MWWAIKTQLKLKDVLVAKNKYGQTPHHPTIRITHHDRAEHF